jgi:indolepyruvate ferredoxin oxidoreductase alpha subunit
LVKKLLSGNEALALGAYDAGLAVATAYPGTPSTEILQSLAGYNDIYTEWSTNEQVAVEVALGAAYTGVRTLAVMKHVGLNVASDAFMAAATTGIVGGMVVISADDPGIHSSQNEQDNRHYAELAKVPLLEPADSQEAYDLMAHAFDISERFDTPVLVRVTTRISHSQSVVETGRRAGREETPGFRHDAQKYVMLPTSARRRRPVIEERLSRITEYAEAFPFNRVTMAERNLGIITSGVACQYAREVFPEASFLKLALTYPLSHKQIVDFAAQVGRLLIVEELDPFLEHHIKAMGIEVMGKDIIPRIGELNVAIVREAADVGRLKTNGPRAPILEPVSGLPQRPPLLCAGCPHSGLFFVLSSLGQRGVLPGGKERPPKLIITGDIGCYTLAAYPPLSAIDTCGCMGASIGQAIGLEKAGVKDKIVAVIGDSTFMHAGITGLIDAVYNQSRICVIILDNETTAMTGHQGHPGTGISASGAKATKVELEGLVRGAGVNNLAVIDAFDLPALKASVRAALASNELSVVIVRGYCPTLTRARTEPLAIEASLCDQCNVCLLVGCPAIQRNDDGVFIESSLCVGRGCTLCQQLCPKKAIYDTEAGGVKGS